MKRLLLSLSALALLGVGCLGGGNADTQNDGGVFRTRDAGETWEQLTTIPTSKGVGSIAPTHILELAMDPQDPATIYAATREDGLLYTHDGGATWRQPLQADLRTGTIGDIAVDAKNLCTLYIAKGNRLYKSDTCLRRVSDQAYVETRSGVFVTAVTVDWYNPQAVWMGLSSGDVLKSEDGGRTWRTALTAKQDITAILLSRQDSRVALVGTERFGFYKTSDGGKTWTNIQKELQEWVNAKRVYSMAQDKNSRMVVASTRYGILASRDFGDTWTPLTLVSRPGEAFISSLAVAPDDDKRIYYGADNLLYRSEDGGVSWTTRELPTTRRLRTFLVDPRDRNVVYVGGARDDE